MSLKSPLTTAVPAKLGAGLAISKLEKSFELAEKNRTFSFNWNLFALITVAEAVVA